jgi:hypothetical protein
MRPDRAAMLNALVNQPDVLMAMAPGYDHVDMSSFFGRFGNIMLGDEHGAGLFAMHEPRIYEAHFLFPDATRPRRLVDVCRGMLRTMFTDYDAKAIVGDTPADNARARAMTRALGFTPQGLSATPSGRRCVHYRLTRMEWAELAASLPLQGVRHR